MYSYMQEHEKYIRGALDSTTEQDFERLRDYLYEQISFMQHERLVHLLVTLAFALFMLVSYIAGIVYEVRWLILTGALISILEIFYIVHYYRLENGVQRWYLLYDEICKRGKYI
ncbi:MAG: hypothetical protein ACM3ZR_01615 [Pseudomonadota bacterium]